MAKNYLITFMLSGLTILLLVTACTPAPAVVSTQPQPLSTSNPDAFSTLVAETAGVFITQTMQAIPTATETILLPTETPPPTGTATSTDDNESTSLTEMEDGTTQFFDYQAGVKLSFPAGWLAVRLSELEFMDAWVAAVDDPIMLSSMEAVQSLDPVTYRVHAFNTQEGYVYDGQGSTIAVLFAQSDMRELENLAEDELQPKGLESYRLIAPSYQVRPDGLELFILEESWQGVSSTEQPVMIYHERVIFKVSTGTVMIDLYAPLEIQDSLLPEFDTLIEQISIFVP